MEPVASLKVRALQLLAQREHSRLELRRKLLAFASRQAAEAPLRGAAGAAADDVSFSRRLKPSSDTEACVDALLDDLAADRHLSESRFVESRVRARASRLGNLRIRRELAQHGLRLSPEEAQALEGSEFERARQVWARKFDAPASEAADRARQARFLASRGFSSEVIRRLLRGDGD
jgi:regulatory protein